MSGNHCKITGCVLVDKAYNRAVVGDLFEYGSAWVFNANGDENKETAWQTAEGLADTVRQLVVEASYNFFERRAVIVLEMGHWAQLNEAARKYLRSYP